MTDPISSLPPDQRERLESLMEALGNPALTYPEEASFAIVAGLGAATVDNLVDVFRRVMQANRFT